MDKPERVFISHPFSSNPRVNLSKVDKICKDLTKNNQYLPISPLHLFSYFEEEKEEYRDTIIEHCYDEIERCYKFFIFGYTDGCIKEARRALYLEKPMYYCVMYSDGKESRVYFREIDRNKFDIDMTTKEITQSEYERIKYKLVDYSYSVINDVIEEQ